MKRKAFRSFRCVIFLCILMLVSQIFILPAAADDAELKMILPGQWIFTDEVEGDEDVLHEADLAFLALENDGTMSLSCDAPGGGYAYSCEGTWSFELVEDGMDKLTLLFTSTDAPVQAEGGYRVECVYNVYSESWEEDGLWVTWLILEPVSCSGVSPFEDVYGYDSLALRKKLGTYMKVVNCKEFVSLRKEPSTASARLLKVPLGAVVLVFPEHEQKNGFIYCEYEDQYGYVLSEYLEETD